MYVPRHFAADDATERALLERPGLAELVTATPTGPVVTPFPALFDPSVGARGAILGHLARGNDHWRQEVVGEALVILRGPDAYVTPSWYESKAEHGRVVPTWNYVTLQAYGELVVHDDPVWLAGQVRRLTDLHEDARQQPWSVDDAPAGFVARQLNAIVGIELRIGRLEGKAKLSQNRDDADASGVVAGLRAEGDEVLAAAVADARTRTHTPAR